MGGAKLLAPSGRTPRIGAHGDVGERGQRKTLVFSHIGGDFLVILSGENQIGSPPDFSSAVTDFVHNMIATAILA